MMHEVVEMSCNFVFIVNFLIEMNIKIYYYYKEGEKEKNSCRVYVNSTVAQANCAHLCTAVY